MDPSLIQEFVIESTHALESVEHDLLSLEQSPNPATFNRMFRALHSIKGSSAVLELPALESLAHRAETLLDLLRHKSRRLTGEGVDTLLRCVDALRQMLHRNDFGAMLNVQDVFAALTRLIETDESRPERAGPTATPRGENLPTPSLSSHTPFLDDEGRHFPPLSSTLLMTPFEGESPPCVPLSAQDSAFPGFSATSPGSAPSRLLFEDKERLLSQTQDFATPGLSEVAGQYATRSGGAPPENLSSASHPPSLTRIIHAGV